MLDPQLRQWDAASLDQLDTTVRAALGRQLITPDMVHGNAKTLRSAVTGRGWPTLGKTHGKIMVILSRAGVITRTRSCRAVRRSRGGPCSSPPPARSPAAAVIKMDDPNEARIQQLVKEGFIVRTRADADLVEARANDVTRRDLALRDGAQIVSTDFEVAVPAIGDYVVQIPGGTPARCDPVNAPKNCRPSDVENPKQLRRP